MTSEDRFARSATLILWLLGAWIVMTVTHELGHVIAGIVGGARLTQLELRPWHLPHSLFADDQHPLFTLWAGPLLGSAIPLFAAAILRRPAVWLVAWFCLLANASYLLLGYFSGDGELDSTRMIRAGTPPIVLLGAASAALLPGYLKFRGACVDLMSGQTGAMSRRARRNGFAILAAVLAIQAVIGTIIRSAL